MSDDEDVTTPPARTKSHLDLLTVLAAAITSVLWASAFVAVRAAGHDYSPGALTLGRQLVGSAALTLIVLAKAAHKRRFPALPRGRLLLAVLAWGIAWFGLYNLSLNTAERHLDAGTTALLVNLAPALIVVLAVLFLREPFTSRLITGLVISFSGVTLIAATTWTGTGDLVGVLCGLAAALVYAFSATAQKPLLARTDALTLTWLGCVVGTLAGLPFGSQLAQQVASAPASSTFSVVYLGVFPTSIAFFTWAYALSRTPASRLAASMYVIPVLVVVLSWLILAEIPAPLAIIGGALCLTGVAVATLAQRPRPRTTPRSEMDASTCR